jgi:hypothetical protein
LWAPCSTVIADSLRRRTGINVAAHRPRNIVDITYEEVHLKTYA